CRLSRVEVRCAHRQPTSLRAAPPALDLMPGSQQRFPPWPGPAPLVIVADQVTKGPDVQAFPPGESLRITSFFNLVRVHNTGAAFSFLAGASGWQRWFFVALGAVATVFIVSMLRRHGDQRRFSLALSLILGGALGNVVDRLLHGH